MDACPFCEIVGGTRPAHVVLATPAVMAFMDGYRQPADPGHVLVIPREHVENLYAVDDALGADLFAVHARVARAVKKAFAPDGITTWSSNEPAGGQEVMHFHLHVFPRRRGVKLDDAVVRQEPEVPVADGILGAAATRIRNEIAALARSSPGARFESSLPSSEPMNIGEPDVNESRDNRQTTYPGSGDRPG